MIEGLVAPLRAEATAVDERRLLVLAGETTRTRERAVDAIEALDVDDSAITVVGPDSSIPGEHVETVHADRLLGQTRDVMVLDCHERCDPNALGQVVGAVDGGGLLVMLVPPLETWSDRRDDFDAALSVPPFNAAEVTGNFRRRLVDTLRSHPGIAIVDVDSGTVERDGLTDPAPRIGRATPEAPDEHAFPEAAYAACLTGDQMATVRTLERLREPGQAVVVAADRGRGKSSAAGLAAGALAFEGRDVLVTAPEYRSAAEVFARAAELVDEMDIPVEVDSDEGPREIRVDAGRVLFAEPVGAAERAASADVLFVDEAASLPVDLLSRFLDAPAVAFTSSVRGYEGAGRGFDVRFRDRLADSEFDVTERAMVEPIRYAAGDPIETWAFRSLLLDASPPVEPLVVDATPDTVDYARIEAGDLLADEHLLRAVFGLLVVAHYRTEPADLARLLDAPNVTVRALTHDGHVVSVALLAREGSLPADLRAEMYEGGRIAGNMIPDVLTSQLRDESAGISVGQRVMRIATHDAVRGRGLGSRLLAEINDEFADEVDWLGTGYGATPGLVDFWAQNGYRTVHLSTSRNERSGEHSAIMLTPTSDAGEELLDRHTGWFLDRIEGMLSDPLDDLDPDVVRAVLRTVDRSPELDLSEFEWRVLAGSPHGAGLYDTAPDAFARLALRHLTDPVDDSLLSASEERLLVQKTLQHQSWETVTGELGYHSARECMRTLGGAIGALLDAYGDERARTEQVRFE